MRPSAYLVFGDLHGRVLPVFKLVQDALDVLLLEAPRRGRPPARGRPEGEMQTAYPRGELSRPGQPCRIAEEVTRS